MIQPAGSRTPAIVGFLAAGALLIGASFLARSRDGAPSLPALHILEPAAGDSVANPLSIVFRTTAPLRFDPAAGWSAGELHLHAMVGDTEFMPAAADLTPLDSSFVWRLPPLDPGTHRLHLTWAGRHHGNLRGVTDTITVHVAQ